MSSLSTTNKNTCTSSTAGAAGAQGPQGPAGGGAFVPGFQSVTSGVNIVPTASVFTLFVNANGGAVVEGMPAAAGFAGYIINVKKTDNSNNTVGVQGSNGSELIDGVTLQTLTAAKANIQMQSDGVQWNIL